MIRMYTQTANFTSSSLDGCLAKKYQSCSGICSRGLPGIVCRTASTDCFLFGFTPTGTPLSFSILSKAYQQARDSNCNFATQALDAHAAMAPCKSASHCCPCPASASWSFATHLRIAQLDAQSTPQATRDRPIPSPEPGHSGTRTEVREQGQARQNRCSMDTCGQSSSRTTVAPASSTRHPTAPHCTTAHPQRQPQPPWMLRLRSPRRGP
ncbi:hypothetical protein CKAH01_05008 [Colletotrichum kahawae]|uniref:Uncharacterized protein n=1 Tax=Colletotrichum kahawae TaxID=34407 RepID=A0AAE0D7E3_COLKA|nr:hypothetical protein CKAH01_05008 [Colletotrichum kahawae]